MSCERRATKDVGEPGLVVVCAFSVGGEGGEQFRFGERTQGQGGLISGEPGLAPRLGYEISGRPAAALEALGGDGLPSGCEIGVEGFRRAEHTQQLASSFVEAPLMTSSFKLSNIGITS